MLSFMLARVLAFLLLVASPLSMAAERAAPVATGDTAPDFTLPDQNGRSHRLSAERGKRAVVLVFYRGHW